MDVEEALELFNFTENDVLSLKMIADRFNELYRPTDDEDTVVKLYNIFC